MFVSKVELSLFYQESNGVSSSHMGRGSSPRGHDLVLRRGCPVFPSFSVKYWDHPNQSDQTTSYIRMTKIHSERTNAPELADLGK